MNKEYTFKLSDFKILYINLDRRPERRRNIEDELKRLGLKGTRISAVDGQSFSPEEQDYWMDRKNFNTLSREPSKVFGRVGCYLSHLKLMKYALDHRIEPLLVLEDDCKFLCDRNDVSITMPKDADIFYLGGLYWWKTDKNDEENDYDQYGGDQNDMTFENMKDYLYYDKYIQILPKYFRIACTFAYVLPTLEHIRNLFTTMLEVKKKAVDMMYVTYFQSQENCYIINPSLCIQSDQFTSDITDLGTKTPTKPQNNTYFYDEHFYSIPITLHYYNNHYEHILELYKNNRIPTNMRHRIEEMRYIFQFEQEKDKK